MVRRTRAELQELNRVKVLAAAREEFTERGFRDTKIDDIADRAGLTRGAVYSNFPGKRALYFAVLAQLATGSAAAPRPTAKAPTAEGPGEVPLDGLGEVPADGPREDSADGQGQGSGEEPAEEPGGTTARETLAAFARVWLARLPLAMDGPHDPARLGRDLIPEIAAAERIRLPFAQLMKLDALILGLALERMRPPAAPVARRVRVAEAVLTTLHGVGQMAAAAPGFVEPFDIVGLCEGLADLDLGDEWAPPYLPFIPQARPADEPWVPPAGAHDALRGRPARLTGDGVVAVLGSHRLQAAEEAVRSAPPGAQVTVALVTGDPGELGPLARLVVADLCSCLRLSFPRPAWPHLQVVHDESGALAAAAGVAAVSDATEAAVRIREGRIVARADGHGACHAAASAP